MQVVERSQDANLANQVYQWAIRGDLSSIYADYTGDVLWKSNLKTQALDWWKRIARIPTQGRAEERTCAERFLINGGNPPAELREHIQDRWPELNLRVAAHKATDTLRLQGDVAAFARAIAQLEQASSDLPFVSEDWRGFVGTWRDFAISNQTYIEGDNPAYKDFKKLDEVGKIAVYQAVRELRGPDYSAWALCDHLLGGGADTEVPMSRLQRVFRATKYTHNDQSRWNTFRYEY